MAKDILGNEVKIGDKLFFNGMAYTVKDLQENRVLGGRTQGKGMQGMKIPDNITLEVDITFNADQPINGVVCKQPLELDGAKSN